MQIFKRKFLFFILMSFSLIFYGIIIGKYKAPPYFLLDYLQDFLTKKYSKKYHNSRDKALEDQLKKISENLIVENKSVKELEKIKISLKQKIIPNTLLDIEEIKRDENSYFLKNKYYGIKTKSILYKSKNPKNCLRIYIQGHGGNPIRFQYHSDLKTYFLENGCDMLSFSMLGIGLNKSEADFPTSYGNLFLSDQEATNHNLYAYFFDKKNPNLDPLTLFLFPSYSIIKNILSQYNDIAMIGISGGGWKTVMLAALLPEVKTSVSISGTIPFAYKHLSTNLIGDWEDVYSYLYKEISYFDLYQLMTLDKQGEKKRKAFLVYNKEEPFFTHPYTTHFKNFSNSKSFLKYKVLVEDKKYHVIDPELIIKLLEK